MPPRIHRILITSAFVAALGGLLFGFDTAVIAGTTHALTQLFQLSPASLGVTVSSALWGTIVGAMFAGYAGERWGRRDSLRVMAVLYVASALGCSFAWSWSALLVFRIIGGLGIGGSSVLGPMYIAEISPAAWRGRLVGLFQFNIVGGILLAYLSNYILGRMLLGAMEWRWELGVAAIPAALFLVFLLFIPRSPRWLVKKQRMEAARQVLAAIGEPDIDRELAQIAHSVDFEQSASSERLFSRKYRLPIFLAVSISMFCQLSGINAVLYYLNDIFGAAGFTKISGDLQAVSIGVTNLVFTVLGVMVIDKIGRKPLLLIGSLGMAGTLLGVSAIFYTHRHQALLVWLLIGYAAFFSFSEGAVVWVYLSEVFPNRVRAKGQSLGSMSQWLMNTLISGIFPLFASRSGAYPFVFFASMMVLQFFVVLFIYPETKGVSLEKIQDRLSMMSERA